MKVIKGIIIAVSILYATIFTPLVYIGTAMGGTTGDKWWIASGILSCLLILLTPALVIYGVIKDEPNYYITIPIMSIPFMFFNFGSIIFLLLLIVILIIKRFNQ